MSASTLEEALSVKGLRPLFIAVTVVSILVPVSVAYSVYQEVNYFTEKLREKGPEGLVSMTPTHLSISGLELENRGILPIALELTATFYVGEARLSSASLGPLTVQPGEKKMIDFTLPFSLDQILSDPEQIRVILLKGANSSVKMQVNAGMQPFVEATIKGDLNRTMGPVFKDFTIRAGSPAPHNDTHVAIPTRVSFTNQAPFPVSGVLSAKVTSTPLRPTRGIYGSSSMDISVNPEERFERTEPIYVLRNAFAPGRYSLEMTFSAFGSAFTWTLVLEV